MQSNENLVAFFYMDQIIKHKTVSITIRRDDLLHKEISGNKFRKLKYNISYAKSINSSGIITFGGAFSNHLAATAAAGKVYGIDTLGIVRGQEWQEKTDNNKTLYFAQLNGMKLHFIDRNEYKLRNDVEYIKTIQSYYPNHYIVPEGGSNDLAIKGCEEIVDPVLDSQFNYVCCAVGTGATISGIINVLNKNQIALGFAALNDFSILDSIENWNKNKQCDFKVIFDYNLGAYAKISDELIRFINEFFNKFGIPLDPIYTAKMFYGIFDMIDKETIKPYSNVLAIHTGGLQGIDGINQKLAKKNKELIQVVF